MMSAGDDNRLPRKTDVVARAAWWGFLVSFGLFVANIAIGKASLALGFGGRTLFGDVTEFILLLVAMAFFVSAALRAERSERPAA